MFPTMGENHQKHNPSTTDTGSIMSEATTKRFMCDFGHLD
jgi:hypothetical protein